MKDPIPSSQGTDIAVVPFDTLFNKIKEYTLSLKWRKTFPYELTSPAQAEDSVSPDEEVFQAQSPILMWLSGVQKTASINCLSQQ